MFKKIVVVGLLLLCALAQEAQMIRELQDSDFPQILQDQPYLFVKFYTPWCTHCKKLAPIFEELALKMKEEYPQVQLAKMDLEANKQTGGKYNVQSYPTLILFKNGIPVKFGGSRTLEFMTFWIGKKTMPPLIPIEEERLTDLETDGKVNIVFYGDLSSDKAAVLAKISNADDYNMYYQAPSGSKPADSVEIFRPFGKSIQNNKIDLSIKNWIGLFDRPFVYPFDDRASGEVFQDKRNAVFLFAPAGQTGQDVRELLLEVAADWKLKYKRRLVFTEIQPESESYTGLSDYMKINPQKHFLLFVKIAEKFKYLYKGLPEELTKEAIEEFIKNVEAKKIKPFKLEQETRPGQKAKASDEL